MTGDYYEKPMTCIGNLLAAGALCIGRIAPIHRIEGIHWLKEKEAPMLLLQLALGNFFLLLCLFLLALIQLQKYG